MIFSIATESLTLRRINLSGATPIFYRERAWTLFLGNPSTIKLVSCSVPWVIQLFTASITSLSSTNLWSATFSLIFLPRSVYFWASYVKTVPTLTRSYPNSCWTCWEIALALDPGGPTMKILKGSFFPIRLIKKSIGFSGLWIKSCFWRFKNNS